LCTVNESGPKAAISSSVVVVMMLLLMSCVDGVTAYFALMLFSLIQTPSMNAMNSSELTVYLTL